VIKKNQTIKSLVILTSFLFLLTNVTGCGGSSSDTAVTEDNQTSPLPSSPLFSYEIVTDVIYGQGLTHSSWNSLQVATIDLELDLYLPSNNEPLRPVVLFIHGGGFSGGDKSDPSGVEMINYFAVRGFVGISINYRLLRDYGTLPSEIVDTVEQLPGLTTDSKDKLKAWYPATRDAKAAVRWVHANAQQYNIDTDHITIIGGSAGSLIAVALAVTEPEDYKNELTELEDTTLQTTNLSYDSHVHTVINHWGGPGMITLLETVYGLERWDNTDTPISIVHGTADDVVLFSNAIEIKENYEFTGVPFVFYPLDGLGHGPWGATVDGKTLSELAFEFIVDIQSLDTFE
jgi:para-nitrobenzyl esterase